MKIVKYLCPLLFKGLLFTFLYALLQFTYNIEIIRDNVEDVGFDLTNKLILHYKKEALNAPNLLLFGFDDYYMNQEGLYDEYNQTNYGYLFPRDRIVRFIDELDNLVNDIAPENRPKALFIDFDISYSSLPYGKELSVADQSFLEVLKKDRPYVILLPKTNKANIVEQSSDPILKEKIKEQKIVLVSVDFLKTNDYVTRRYVAYEEMKNGDDHNEFYPNANVALWYLSHDQPIDEQTIRHTFDQRDIIANRVVIKNYLSIDPSNNEPPATQSLWEPYCKYSAAYSLYEIPEEDFANATLMLGTTYSNNLDSFDVLDVFFNESIQGIELHANTLMSIHFFDGQIKMLDFWNTMVLVFITFVFVDILVRFLFNRFKKGNRSLYLVIDLLLMGIILLFVSIYLLLEYKLWINWFVPFVIYGISDLLKINCIKDSQIVSEENHEKNPNFFNTICKHIRKLSCPS